MQQSCSTPTVTVRDPLVRLAHWGLVVAFAPAYLSEGAPEWLHSYAGYAIAGIVGLRVIWGFVGPRRARFSDFATRPGRCALMMFNRGTAESQEEFHGEFRPNDLDIDGHLCGRVGVSDRRDGHRSGLSN